MRKSLGEDLVRVQSALRSLSKGDASDKAKKAMKAIQDALDEDDAAVLVGDMADLLEVAARDGGAEALAQVGITNDDDITSLVNDHAVEFANESAADLVGMKWVDGELVDNPDADYAIDDATREMLRSDVETAMQDGLSNDALADVLADNYAFSDSRAEAIARTETAFADVQGNLSAYKESGVVDGKQWVTSADACDECQALSDVVVSLDDEFPDDGGDGPPLHPRCFLPGTIVSAIGVTAQFKRRFVGKVTVIDAPGIDQISCTPNHPILTQRGWVAAGSLQLDDCLVQCVNPRTALAGIEPDDNYVEARIEEIASALWMARGMSSRTVPVTAIDFHGDGIIDSEVSIVRPNGSLTSNRSVIDELPEDQALGIRHCTHCGAPLNADGSSNLFSERDFSATNGDMSSADSAPLLIGSELTHLDEPCIGMSPDLKAEALPSVSQGGTVTTDSPSYINARLAGHIAFVKITHLGNREYDGHVYNLETKDGWYCANGIIAHNCECDVLPVLSDEDE